MVTVRRVLLFVLVCALPVSAGMAALPMVRASSPASSGGGEVRNLELVRSYYAVVGDALQTGDIASVEGFLAADFVEHQDRTGMPAGKAGVLAHLATMHTSLVDIELTVDTPLADGDRVSARVTVSGRQRAEFVGIPMEPATLEWESIDVWRIADGELAEHWGDGDGPSLFEPLVRVGLDAYPVNPIVAALAELTISPGASLKGNVLPGPSIFLVTAGELSFEGNFAARVVRPRAEGASDEPEIPVQGADVSLRPGEAVVLTGLPPTLVNDGRVRATGLLVSLFPTAADAPLAQPRATRNDGLLANEDFALAMYPQAEVGTGATPDGVAVTPLTGGVMTEPLAGPLKVELGRAHLAPGGGIARHTVSGFEAVAAETGTLDLQPGDAARSAGAVSTIRNATESPAVALVLTLRAAGE